MKKYYIETRRTGTSYIKYNEGRLCGLVDILLRNCILRHTTEGKIEGAGKRERRFKHP